MAGFTYGALMSSTVKQVGAAMDCPPGAAEFAQTAADIAEFVRVAAGHSALLAKNQPLFALPAHLHRTLAPAGAPRPTPTKRGATPGPWRRSARTLATAHDVLATQVDLDGYPRGPDAEYLADQSSVHVASARLVDLCLTVAAAADELASHGREGQAEAVRKLRAIADLGVPLNELRRPDIAKRHTVLDEVVPLLTSDKGDPLDRRLDALRLGVHRLAHIETAADPQILSTLADFGAVVARYAQTATARAERTNRAGRVDRRVYEAAIRRAAATLNVWQGTSLELRHVVSPLVAGRQVHSARQLASGIAELIRDSRDIASVSRAALILPELAVGCWWAARRWLDDRLLLDRETHRHLGWERQGRLNLTYAQAVRQSRDLVGGLLSIPGASPRPLRAMHTAYLAVPMVPLPVEDPLDFEPPGAWPDILHTPDLNGM